MIKIKISILISFCLVLFYVSQSFAQQNMSGISFDFETRYQTIEGFGSCIVNYRDFPPEYSKPEFFDRAVNDLGVSLMRVPLMEHTEWKNDDDDPNHFNWNGFWLSDNIDRKGIETSMHLMQKFREQGVERFMATPWSPPEFMKTQRSPIQGGYLRADMFDEYAEYMAAQIILAKKNYGIDINWVTVQNELLFAQFFRSCVYQPWVLKEAIRSLMHKFEKEGINTRILMPEDMFFFNRMWYYIQPTMNDPETRNFNGHFTTHRHGGKEDLLKWMAETNQYNRQNWMTETSGHEPTWAGALKMATDIQEYLVYGNFSAWVYWQLSGGGSGRYSIMVDGKPGNKYYASKHFYRYVRPNAIRIGARSSDEKLFVSAFHHPHDGTLTAVVINNGESLVKTPVNSIYHFDVYQSTQAEQFAHSRLKSGDLLSVPPKSITTLFVKDRKLLSGEARPLLTESWENTGTASSEKWGNPAPFPRSKPFQVKPDGGNITVYPELKDADPNEVLNQRMHNGWSNLHLTVMNGDGDAVNYLLGIGADVNAKADDGLTPFHMAAAVFKGNEGKENRIREYSKYDIFKMIMDAGADINARTSDGWTPLHFAVANAYTGYRGNPENSLNRIRDLVDAGANVEAKDTNGRTPLHWAALQGYLLYSGVPSVKANAAELLIEKGADIHATDKNGDTPLHLATKMGYPEIVLALFKAGAKSDLKNKKGETPKEIAGNAKDEVLLYIFDNIRLPGAANVSVDLRKNSKEYKWGPELVKAAWRGDLKEVQRLLEIGADAEYRDMDGFNALERARDSGHEEIVELLSKEMKK